MNRMCLAVCAALLCGQAAVHTTSYPPVTFDQLVARADMIFVGDVIDVRAFPVATREGTIIKTRVTFRVSDPLFGTTSALELLEFLGGEWDGVGMAIAGMPRFAEGDRRVVFAYRKRSINPIVGFTHGLLRVSRDAGGVDRVLTVEGAPVARPESIGASATRTTGPAPQAMSLSDLRARIRSALAAGRRQ
jgi:hypothetical protein